MYAVTMGMIFILRDRCEGLFYNTSYSAMLGDGALVVVVLMAAEIVKRGSLPEWLPRGGYHLVAAGVGVAIGLVWFGIDLPRQWGDRYHHIIIAPLLVYLSMTLLPVIVKNGTKIEKIATICLIAIWAVLVIYDAKVGRLDQRNYRSLGRCLDILKSGRLMVPNG
jgi:hypothetical protein